MSLGSMKVAGCVTTAPFTATTPSASSFSASRRLATPARASHLAMRSPRPAAASPASVPPVSVAAVASSVIRRPP